MSEETGDDYWVDPPDEDDPLFIPEEETDEECEMPSAEQRLDLIAEALLQLHTTATGNRQHESNYASQLLQLIASKKFDEVQTLEAGAASRVMHAPPPYTQ